MSWLVPVTLSNEYVDLIPLGLSYDDELIKAATDGELWNLWYTMIPKPEGMKAEIQRRLSLQQADSMLPFTIIDRKSAKAVGMTTFMNADKANQRIEIGSTWYAKSTQRTGINRKCKLLMLTHTFESWSCNVVEFRTHFFNKQSRTAIEGLGAKLDGILRNHMITADSTLRDTCVYSILNNEWPTVKTHLSFQMNRSA